MKRTFSILLALFLCLSLFACGKQPETPPVEEPPPVETPPAVEPAPQPETPPQEEPVPADPLPGEQVAPGVPEVIFGDYGGRFPDDSGAYDMIRITANLPHIEALPQIHDYYQTLWEDMRVTYGLSHEEAIRQWTEYQATGQEFTPWTVEVEFQVTRNDGTTLSLLRSVTEEWPGHESVQYYAETFDVAAQGRLLLGDLFQPGADYLTRLADSSEVDQLNFALSDDSLMLCIEGGYRALPLSDLSDILQPQYVTE